MKIREFKNRVLGLAISQAKLLCEYSMLEDIKKEPEQLRKNIGTIQSILHDTEDFLNEIENACSNSDISISE